LHGPPKAVYPVRRPARAKACGLLRVWRFSLVTALLAVAGCRGSADVRVVPLMRTDFTEREPLVQQVPVDEAYYWLEDGRLWISLRCYRPSALGPAFAFDWEMSLVVDGLPAGSARLYPLKGEAVRVVQTVGGDQRRSRGWTGVAVIHAPENGRLQGRFHCNVRQQQFTLLRGWQPSPLAAPMFIVVGRFEAVENAELGRAIRDETEAAGFERMATATRPSSAI